MPRHVHRAPYPQQRRFHRIQADAATGDGRRHIPGGKSCLKEHARDLRIGVRNGQAARGQLAADGGDVEAAAIVGDGHGEPFAMECGADGDGRNGRLASRSAICRWFDAVINRVAHQMEQ